MTEHNIEIKEYVISGIEGNIFVKEWIPNNLVDNVPLMLMHDSLGCVELWRSFPKILATALSKRVIAYDRLGFGQSSECTTLATKSFIKEEALQHFPYLKKQLNIRDYLLLGHSVGGVIAINIAANDRDCQGVITIASQAFVEPLTRKGIKEAQTMFQNAEQMQRLEKYHGARAKWLLSSWINIWLSAEFSTWSLEDCIGKIQCPVLALHGDKDEYGSKAFPEFIINKVANSGVSNKNKNVLVMLKDCGHAPHKEKTEQVLTSVTDFVLNNI